MSFWQENQTQVDTKRNHSEFPSDHSYKCKSGSKANVQFRGVHVASWEILNYIDAHFLTFWTYLVHTKATFTCYVLDEINESIISFCTGKMSSKKNNSH